MVIKQRAVLERVAAATPLPHRQVVQARGLLLACDGVANEEIARQCRVDSDTLRRWPYYLGHHSPCLPRVGEPLFGNIAVAASRPVAARLRASSGQCADTAPVRVAEARFSSVVQVSSLTVTVPETVDVKELEEEIVTAAADRLRDDHGYELVAAVRASASGTGNEYPLHPGGSIVVDREPGVLRVKLQGVKVDADDLFTGVSSGLEQRHEGLRVEIG